MSAMYGAVLADFNQENGLDMAVATCATSNVIIILGNGNGSFARYTTFFTGNGSKPVAVAVTDVNKDNQLDIISDKYGSESVGVFYGNGDGNF